MPPRPPAPYDYCVTAVRAYTFVPNLFDPYAWEFAKLGLAVPGPGAGQLTVPEGAAFCSDRSTSVFDDVGDFFSGFVDAIAKVVNFIADLYNSIKEDVITFAAKAVEFAGIDCEPDTFCRDTLDYAMTTALAAAGLPPSLPDFDALVNDGIDYVAG